MTRSAIPLFLNPTAGRGRAGKIAGRIGDLLSSCGVKTERIESTAVGDLEHRVRDHVAVDDGPIIVAGGDGSVHEAINGILSAGKRNPLGLIPIGTGNDFAKACAFSLDWQVATRALAGRLSAGRFRAIDAGRMNDRFFANGAGIGFDAKINRIARKYRWPVGDLVYLFAVMEGMWDGVITPAVRMRYDDLEFSGRVTLANISNGPWVGGMFYIAPMAHNDDGMLDLIVAEPVSRARVLLLLPRLIRGTHVDAPQIACHRIRSLTLIADAPVPSHLDGEVQALQTDFSIDVLPDALQIV